jgi:RNA 2',3'-cyclic 3'-phosphodiesterase
MGFDRGAAGRGRSREGWTAGPRPFARPADDPPGTSRLFVAVPVADDVRAAIGRLMEEVAGAPIEERAPGQPRWVRVDGLHVTLRFLGATPDDRQPALAGALAASARGVAPFRVALSGGGAFPNMSRPRVLWVGISEGEAQLVDLSARLDTQLGPLGWPPQGRAFEPHLTLARTDGVAGAGETARRLADAADRIRLGWPADRLVLYKSVLGRGPARYEVVAEAALV